MMAAPVNSAYTADNLGVMFDEEPVRTPPPDTNYIRGTPDIEWTGFHPKRDKWNLFQACYTAKPNDNYITIGGFHNNTDVDLINYFSGGSTLF